MSYVQLTLSSNKLFVYIKTEKIIEFYADSDNDGLPCTKIVTDDGEYTCVTESLSQVFSEITKTEKAEVSDMVKSITRIIPEETRPTQDEIEARAAAEVLKKYCESKSHCAHCMFFDAGGDYMCKLYHDPNRWEIPEETENILNDCACCVFYNPDDDCCENNARICTYQEEE